MILSITSTIETFKSVEFRPGLNVLLADKTSTSTEKQTRNSAGKTSLVEIIHFLLGGEADKKSLFQKQEIAAHSFIGIFEIRGQQITVTRSGSDEKKIILRRDEADALQIPLHHDEESGATYVTPDEWRDILGNGWFALPRDRHNTPFEEAFAPTFRYL